MTLEEAIKHAEATAIENEKEAKRKREHGGWYYDSEARACAICAEENRQLAEWLRELQERRKRPEQRWIPCSERLPEKDGRYQVTRYDYVANTEFIDILWYEENLWWNRHSTGDYAVTAWMPLPEPYQNKERRADG